MSAYLHGLATKADLSPNLKMLLMMLCDSAGEDDGTKCYPSVPYLAYKTGFSVRHTQRLLRVLEAAGYIEPVANIGGGRVTGGRGLATWYRIHIMRVPMRPDWGELKQRLIESGELEPDTDLTDVHRVTRRLKRQRAQEQQPVQEDEQL